MSKIKFILVALSISLILALAAFPLAASAKSPLPPPLPAGSTGLTARIVATSGQTISGKVDATGCDIGIYIGPGITNVKVKDATISGANEKES